MDITRQFLNCFEKSKIPMIIQIFTSSLHYLWCYIFVSIMNLNIMGTALAMNITAFSNAMLITVYVTYFQPDLREAWFWPDKDCFQGLLDYLRLGIPAMLMLCFEWWTFEIQTFMASFISVQAIGSQVIILNSIYFMFCITLGLSYAA